MLRSCLYLALAAICGILFGACSPKHFDSNTLESFALGQEESPLQDTLPPGPAELLPDLGVSAKIAGGPYDQLKVAEIDRQERRLLLQLPLGMNPYVQISQGALDRAPQIYFETRKNAQGTVMLVVSVPLMMILRAAPNAGETLTLPGGGQGRGWVTSLREQNCQLKIALSENAVQLWVISPFDPYFSMTLPLRNTTATQVLGQWQSLPASNSQQGALGLSYTLPSEASRVLKAYF